MNTFENLKTIYLPSNSKCEYFQNRTNHFKVDLPQPIVLKPNSQVALSEIIFPNNILNIYKPISEIYMQNKPNIAFERFLQDGYYRTDEELIKEINTVLQAQGLKTRVKKDKRRKIIKIVVGWGEKVRFHEHLANILGFFDKRTFEHERFNTINIFTLPTTDPKPSSVFFADVEVDVNLLVYAVFIYTDCVHTSVVGTENSQILSIIHCNHPGDLLYIHRTLPVLHFLPLLSNELRTITIQLRNTVGDFIRFKNGKIILKLIIKQQDEA